MGVGTKILIVEDEIIVAEDLRATLRKLGYSVLDPEVSGEAALRAVEESKPDLVLMDVQLKGEMDGTETAQRIKDRIDIPVIYLTAFTDVQTLQRAKVTDPFGYLVKPFQARELQVAIEMALHKHQLERRLRRSEQKYRNLFESVPVGIYQSAPDGTILAANSAMVTILEYPDVETLLESNAAALYVVAQYYDRWREALQRTDVVYNFETRMRTYDDSPLWVQESARAVYEPDGSLSFYECAVMDISQVKWVEAALTQRSDELELLNDASRKFNSTLKLDVVINSVLEEVCRVLDVEAASIWLLDTATAELVCRESVGPASDQVRGWRLKAGTGIVGWVAEHGESSIVHDTREDPRHYKRVADTTGVEMRSILSVPVRGKHKVTGVIQVLAMIPERFRPAEQTLLEALGDLAGRAIENAQLYERVDRLFVLTQEALAQTEALYSFSHRLTMQQETANLPQSLAENIAQVVHADCVLLALLDVETRTRKTLAWAGTSDAPPEITDAVLWDGLLARALDKRQSQRLLTDGASETESALRTWCQERGLGAILIAPLRYQGTTFGLVAVAHHAGDASLSLRDVDLLQAIADQAVLALRNARVL